MPSDPKIEQQEILHENNPYFYLGSSAKDSSVNVLHVFLGTRYFFIKALPIVHRILKGIVYYIAKSIRFFISAMLSQIGFRK